MPSPDDRIDTTSSGAIEQALLALVCQRAPGKTACPSEVARAVAGSGLAGPWRALMPAVRAAADRLAQAGQIRVTQRGQTVSALHAVGPIRLGLAGLQTEPAVPAAPQKALSYPKSAPSREE